MPKLSRRRTVLAFALAVPLLAQACNRELQGHADVFLAALATDDYEKFKSVAGAELLTEVAEANFHDMSATYEAGIRKHAPNAAIVFDRFHVQRLAHDALDEVRREIVRELNGTPEGKDVKGMRWPLQRNEVNHTPKDEKRISTVITSASWSRKTSTSCFRLHSRG